MLTQRYIAYTNQTTTTTVSGYNTSLVFDLTDTNIAGIPAGLYGLSVPDLGEVYGASASVFAEENYQEFEFDVTDGTSIYQFFFSLFLLVFLVLH